MRLYLIFFIILKIIFVYGHPNIKLLMSFETSKYHKKDSCGLEHLQSTTNAFRGPKAPKVTSIDHFCKHCHKRSSFMNKYNTITGVDDDIEKIYTDVKNIEKALDIVCPLWDEDVRIKDKDEMVQWIINNRHLKQMPECISLSKELLVKYASEGDIEKVTLITHVSQILENNALRLGWAAVTADFKDQDECYLDSCWRAVNALTYFKPEICSHGAFSNILKKTCPASCIKIESRLVETGINDCCEDCMGEISNLNDSEKDSIDIHPFKTWKEII